MQAHTQDRNDAIIAAQNEKRNAKRAAWLSNLLPPVAIFLTAFALRYLYNAVFMEHRIAHFGDAYNFMRTGSCLLEALTGSHSFTAFLDKIYHPVQAQAQLLQSMTSMNLTDRLMIDGPVFPAYLALVEWLTGVNPGNPIFDAHSVQICLCNAFIDSLTCVLVYFSARLAFERRTALLAGILFAIYPAAIINTQHCYSEPFSYFLLSCWTFLLLSLLLRHTRRPILRALSWVGSGAFSGLMMLSKPAFILLPPMVTAILLPLSIFAAFKAGKLPAFVFNGLKKAGLALLGAVIVLSPWVLFNKAATGQYSVFVNRVPSFNIFHGNQIGTDAWRCYPFYGTFPGESKLVISSLIEDAKKEPLQFLGLQFKKVARLWSGVWNEYHYSLFGLPLELQSLFHQLLLLGGALGLAYQLVRAKTKTLSREFKAAGLLGCIILFHFAYIPFEAISRYAITAMPAVIILFSSLIAAVSRNKKASLALEKTGAIALFGFFILAQSGTIANVIASCLAGTGSESNTSLLQLAPVLALGLDALCLAGCVYYSAKLLAALIEDKTAWRFSLLLPSMLGLLALLVAGFYTVQSHDWKEWSCKVSPEQSISQTISLPQSFQAPAQTAFVLIDLSSNTLAAPLQVKVNGQLLSDPLVPLAQFQPNNADILQCLAIQAEGMSRDVRGFRNWWVLPFSSTILKQGENSIELSSQDKITDIVVYGDFPSSSASTAADTDGETYLPSLRSFSYTKGFTTFDHRDPRVFEKQQILGKTLESKLIRKDGTDSKDLSQADGVQSGRYRIRILVPEQKAAVAPDLTGPARAALDRLIAAPTQLVSEPPQQVTGNNPLSFLPAQSVIKLPGNLPAGTRFNFSCQTRSVAGKRPYFVSLSFTGIDREKKPHSWTSKWQPIGIASSEIFRTTSFADLIPEEILSLENLEIHPMFSPFQPDYLFLKKKDALKSQIEIKNAELSFLPPLDIEAKAEARSWKLY